MKTSRHGSIALGVVLSGAASLGAVPVRAQGAVPARPDACAKDPVCRDHADRARELSRQGLLDEALKAYQEAFGLQPMPRLVFNIARVQQKLGQLDAAARSYELYLNLGAEGNLEFAAKARSYLDEIYIVSEPSAAPLVFEPPPPPKPTPLYKRWWFWTSIGVGVAAGVTGIAVGATRPARDPTEGLQIIRPF